MDNAIIDPVRKINQNKPTEKLTEVYRSRSSWYSDEYFEALRQILVERGVSDASLDLSPPQDRPQVAHLNQAPQASAGHVAFAIVGGLAGGLVGYLMGTPRHCPSVTF
jgi:hypothetical protein